MSIFDQVSSDLGTEQGNPTYAQAMQPHVERYNDLVATIERVYAQAVTAADERRLAAVHDAWEAMQRAKASAWTDYQRSMPAAPNPDHLAPLPARKPAARP